MSLYDIRGVIHCHTTHSDGSGSVEEIAKAANDAGLDFVVITDKNTQKARQEGQEKYHGSALVIVGAEVAPENGGRYIASVWGEQFADRLGRLDLADAEA